MMKLKTLVLLMGMLTGAQSFAAVLVTVTNCQWVGATHPVYLCNDFCYAVSGGTAVLAHAGACLSSAAKATQEQLDAYAQEPCPDYTTGTSTEAQTYAETSCKAYVKRISP